MSGSSNMTFGHLREQIYGRERWEKKLGEVNRASVLTLWTVVVAEVLEGQGTAPEDAQRRNGGC